MLAEEKGYGSSLDLDVNKWARVCDVCRSATCTVYCRTDTAYLCSGCDAHIHRTATAHERVWVCEACERAPAAFLCKADAASLCAACDADVHSANPLARRHHRVPILPIYGPPPATAGVGSVMIRPAAGDTPDDDEFLTHDAGETTIDEDDEDEAASWLLLNPTPAKNNDNINQERVNNNIKEESENACIDLLEYSSCQENQFNDHHYNLNQSHHYSVPEKNMSYGGDSVVPNKTHLQYYHTHNQTHHGSFQLQGMEYETSTPGYGYPAYSHSVSVSSMDVGVVPESTTSDVSISHSRPPKGTIDLFSGPPVPMDREARVLRYREKKKTRKFEKTIRYASRKAYAETRPRIKGRFAKRTDAEGEVDQMFFTPSMAESGYGIVPLL
nr:zinc finger protein CONSTANS-LIKE 2-like [Ipomoea trifida]